MNASSSWTLLRKDLRLFRVPLVTAMAILAGTYVVAAVVAVGVWNDNTSQLGKIGVPPASPGGPWGVTHVKDLVAGRVVAFAVIPAALVGLGLTAFVCASFGGGAFAAERRDRSAEFLAMLPVPRWRIVVSKLLAALACLLVPCAVHLAVVLLSPYAVDGAQRMVPQTFVPTALALRHIAAMALMMFGVAWLMSAMLDSAALAATVGIGLTVATAIFVGDLTRRALLAEGATAYTWAGSDESVWALINPDVYRSAPLPIFDAIQTVAVAAGVLALLAGAAIYLRRVSP